MPAPIQQSSAFNSTGGRYYPPEYFDSGAYKHMSVNKFNTRGKHMLNNEHPPKQKKSHDRQKSDHGTENVFGGGKVNTVRFELPFDTWCDHCGEMITMGIRFNSEKRRVGFFHTTPLLEFTLKCCFCSGLIKIQTDPENRTYVVTDGGRKKTLTYDASDDPNAMSLPNREEWDKMRADPVARAQMQQEDKKKRDAAAPRLEALKDASDRARKDDFEMHKLLKQKFRETNGLFIDQQKKKQQDIAKYGCVLPAETEEDRRHAAAVHFRAAPSKLHERIQVQRQNLAFDSLLR
eukprot:TRINITY_DN97382_c0_g1_i1.p1 TRINITY_DN97382_c0_g1~~TRINITY_DN97382_c0_g1_i1.p1  ORF type:complete len:291 (-),score=66.68 TRINITY_DN97382_c0_g1_i1:29-901(-)